MSRAGVDRNQLGLWRISKHQELVEIFPFMRERRPSWLPLGHRWTERDRLRIYHALAPFRDLGEIEEVCTVILAASRSRRGRAPFTIDCLLVGLRYLDAAERIEAYRDPGAWLARVGRLDALLRVLEALHAPALGLERLPHDL